MILETNLPLQNLDFSYYDKNENKLVSHRPLDLVDVYGFNTRLFIAMMLAGIFDGYFSTLVKGGIKGLSDLASQNSAFLYPYYWIWMIETFQKNISKMEDGYQVLEKLYGGFELDTNEETFINGLQIGDFNVASKDENGKINGLSLLGYVVLIRHQRGQTDISALE